MLTQLDIVSEVRVDQVHIETFEEVCSCLTIQVCLDTVIHRSIATRGVCVNVTALFCFLSATK